MTSRKIPPNVPRAVLDLDRPRTMTLQFPAILRLRNLDESIEVDDVERLPEIIWAGLVDGDREDLTPSDVAGMIHIGNMETIMTAVRKLTDDSQQPEGAEGNGVPAPPEVKAGKRAKAKP